MGDLIKLKKYKKKKQDELEENLDVNDPNYWEKLQKLNEYIKEHNEEERRKKNKKIIKQLNPGT